MKKNKAIAFALSMVMIAEIFLTGCSANMITSVRASEISDVYTVEDDDYNEDNIDDLLESDSTDAAVVPELNQDASLLTGDFMVEGTPIVTDEPIADDEVMDEEDVDDTFDNIDTDEESHVHQYTYTSISDSEHEVLCECGDVYIEEHNFGDGYICEECGYEKEGSVEKSKITSLIVTNSEPSSYLFHKTMGDYETYAVESDKDFYSLFVVCENKTADFTDSKYAGFFSGLKNCSQIIFEEGTYYFNKESFCFSELGSSADFPAEIDFVDASIHVHGEEDYYAFTDANIKTVFLPSSLFFNGQILFDNVINGFDENYEYTGEYDHLASSYQAGNTVMFSNDPSYQVSLLDNTNVVVGTDGVSYDLSTAVVSWDISKDEDGSVMTYILDTDGDGVGETLLWDGIGETVPFNCVIDQSDSNKVCYHYNMNSVNTQTINSRGFIYYSQYSNSFYASPWTNPNYKENITKVVCSENSDILLGGARDLFKGLINCKTIDLSKFKMSNIPNSFCMFYNCSSLLSIDLTNFSSTSMVDTSCMFYSCKQLKNIVGINLLDMSKVTTISNMFYYCNNLTELNLENWDTGKVTNMGNAFNGCNSLELLNLNGWNTNNVTNMYYMFYNCKSLTSLDVSSFNTNKVINMNGMFYHCDKISSLDLSNFDTSNVITFNSIFSNCGSLTYLDISGFDLSKSTDSNYFFTNTNKIGKIILPSKISDTILIDLPKVFYGYTSSDDLVDEELTYNILPATDLSISLHYIASTEIPLTRAILVDSTEDLFLGKISKDSITSVTFNIGDSSYINGSYPSVSYKVKPTDVSILSNKGAFVYQLTDGSVHIVTSLDKFYTNKNHNGATDMFSNMYNCRSIHGLEYLDLSRSSKANSMFQNYAVTNYSYSVPDVYKSSNVNDLGEKTGAYDNNLQEITKIRFSNAAKLELTIKYQMENPRYDWLCIYPKDVTPTDSNYSESLTSKLGGTTITTKTLTVNDNACSIYFRTDGSGNNYLGYYITVVPYDADGNIIDYKNCKAKRIDLSSLVIPNGISTDNFFTGCNNIEIFVTPDNSKSGILLPYTMYEWPALTEYTELPTTSVILHNTNKISTLIWTDNNEAKYYDSDALDIQDCSYNQNNSVIGYLFDTDEDEVGDVWVITSDNENNTFKWNSNCTKSGITRIAFRDRVKAPSDSSSLFSNWSKLTDIIDLGNLNTEDVIIANKMFFECSSLKNADVSSWNTSKMQDLSSMFENCKTLTTLNVSNWDTGKVTNMENLFSGCNKITELDVSNWNTSNVKNMSHLFYECYSIAELNIKKWNTSNVTTMNSLFTRCYPLISLDVDN